MIPWQHLGTAEIPGDAGQLRLMRRGAEFSIMLGQNELMNSRLSGSEQALATLSWDKLGPKAAPRVLIGGLGMGFTLRAALEILPQDAQIVVVELVSGVVAWARNEMTEVFKGSLEDPRVTILEQDVGAVINAKPKDYDIILLDVDNGPDGLTRASNDRLYQRPGLAAARNALRPGGVLAIWSSGPDPSFTQRLRKTGFDVQETTVRANGKRGGARHMIWLASKPAH